MVVRKVDSGQALGVAWSLMAEFSKASFLLSSACHLQERREGGHCSLLSGCTQKGTESEGEKEALSSWLRATLDA